MAKISIYACTAGYPIHHYIRIYYCKHTSSQMCNSSDSPRCSSVLREDVSTYCVHDAARCLQQTIKQYGRRCCRTLAVTRFSPCLPAPLGRMLVHHCINNRAICNSVLVKVFVTIEKEGRRTHSTVYSASLWLMLTTPIMFSTATSTCRFSPYWIEPLTSSGNYLLRL